MTVFLFMKAAYLALAFIFFVVYLAAELDFSLACAVASVCALVCALCGASVAVQTGVFFSSLLCLCCAGAFARAKGQRDRRVAVVVERVSRDTGRVLCRSELLPARSRDGMITYDAGEVFYIDETSDCGYAARGSFRPRG